MSDPSEPTPKAVHAAVVAQGNPRDLATLQEALTARGIPSQVVQPPGSNPNS